MNAMTMVAVYGSLLRGLGNHGVLRGARQVCEARVAGWRLVDLGAFPGAVPGDGEIDVEVYEVNADTLRCLDQLEGYVRPGVGVYDRRAVTTTCGREALMYVWNRDVNFGDDRVVDGGSWRAHVAQRAPRRFGW